MSAEQFAADAGLLERDLKALKRRPAIDGGRPAVYLNMDR